MTSIWKKKAVVLVIVTFFITVASAPAISSITIADDLNKKINPQDQLQNNFANYMPVIPQQQYIQIQQELQKTSPLSRGWYWKPPYPNYAPHTPGGMPDFDQKQDQWQTIYPGPNGIIDSAPMGDDILNISENCIAPGPNCHLDTVPIGDDIVAWSFCGPVAVANCFWWFDSKYADPTGYPGDGNDIFPLVEDYGAGDDHDKNNVPLLIEKLAGKMKTCERGTTYVSDMQDAIDAWFVDTGLDSFFMEHTYNKPKFEFVEAEIERSQDVILLLGFYKPIKLVDQEQIIWTNYVDLPPYTPGHLQSFIPTVPMLDAVQVLLAANYPGVETDVKVCIWDQLPNPNINPLGCSTMTILPPPLGSPAWFQFHFDPSITLVPGTEYFISVEELTSTYNIHWYYHQGDVYPPGMAWYEIDDWTFQPHPDKDFCFKTEYYGDSCVRTGGHYVTCAGVDSEEYMIAFSDPYWNIYNPSSDDHNDPQFVSHDIYNVVIGCPCPDLDYEWWLPDYPSYSPFTIVEQAVIICPRIPDLDCTGSLAWTNVKPGDTVTGTFTVENIGDPLSQLDWEVDSWPTTWGTWTFSPNGGTDLTPEDGAKTVTVSVEAPDEPDATFTGQIKVVNKDDTSDFCLIDVSLKTPVSKPTLILGFLIELLEKFPIAHWLLTTLLTT